MSTPMVGSVLSILPDSRWTHGVFIRSRKLRRPETVNLPFIGWATVVTASDVDMETYGTAVMPLFADGATIHTVQTLAAADLTLTEFTPVP
jgi:hypothetical protein